MAPFYPTVGIVRCPTCDLVFYEGHESPEGLYTSEYFAGGEYTDYLADKPIIQRNFQRRIAALRRLAPAGNLLEIGAAYGFFLELARSHWLVRGLEISPDTAAHAREVAGLDVQCADFLSVPEEPAAYDLVCMWDTIEHLAHPVRYIEKAGRWLKPGGYLVMTTGDVASLASRARKHRWRLIHPPTHLYYFSPHTLGRAAEGAGLEIVNVSHVGYSRSSRSMLHALLMRGERPRRFLYNLATFGGRVDVPLYLNLYDIMMLVARKPALAPVGSDVDR